MHAIDGPGSINGKFTEGNPATGQDATMVTADWLNDFQANLLAVLTEGSIPPTKGRAADLLDAIKAVAGGVQGGGGGAVPTTRKLTGTGLATIDGNGDLSQDRTVSVKRATAAEIALGQSDDGAITPLGLRQSAAAGLTDTGYAVIPGGLMLQWGSVRGNYGEGPIYKAFATPFPHACFVVAPIEVNPTADRTSDIRAELVDRGKDGFTMMFQRGSGANNSIGGFDFIAIGF